MNSRKAFTDFFVNVHNQIVQGAAERHLGSPEVVSQKIKLTCGRGNREMERNQVLDGKVVPADQPHMKPSLFL